MLVKLIMTIQDPKNSNDDDLMKSNKASMAEINTRKTIKIKEYMLDKINNETFIPIIKRIKNIKVSITSTTPRMIIQFEDLLQIRIVPLGENFLYAIYEGILVQYESVPVPTWHRNSEKYEKYKDFIDMFTPYLENLYRYLSYIVNPNEFYAYLA
jgi:hypothetical protein